MIVRHGYKTYEEAEREVMKLVWKDKYNKRDELHFQVYSRSDENGKRLPISYIKCKETGEMASIYSFDEAEGYAITLLTGEAQGRSGVHRHSLCPDEQGLQDKPHLRLIRAERRGIRWQ